ncbi:cyclic-phosphate processing receiver domain-containing protein [Paenibacillus koleovorans]|uniref:cyclic-phosphate processing receiver domain-containing protein n=1 Tax=Paenibacillus koleovorans TaxID=121608 RepID=UPI000FD945EA|nr:cyclic-phosphate processing receiver domain-containing protein [Paenibacillus koleovorans]
MGSSGKPRIHLYLDDRRPCPEGFVLAKTAEECKQLLSECEVNILSLDFDLGYMEPTGDEVARFLAAELNVRSFPQEIYLHTSSDYGRLIMYQMLYPHMPAGTKLHNGSMPPAVLARAAGGAS